MDDVRVLNRRLINTSLRVVGPPGGPYGLFWDAIDKGDLMPLLEVICMEMGWRLEPSGPAKAAVEPSGKADG